jgi:hypothetical protein
MYNTVRKYKKTSLFLSVSLYSLKKYSSLALDPKFQKIHNTHYDIAIIGGGTGGLSLALESQKLGLKPIIFDYVEPTPHNTTWGIGGCCVNVGCIPKKLFHEAALIKEKLELSQDYGFDVSSTF